MDTGVMASAGAGLGEVILFEGMGAVGWEAVRVMGVPQEGQRPFFPAADAGALRRLPQAHWTVMVASAGMEDPPEGISGRVLLAGVGRAMKIAIGSD